MYNEPTAHIAEVFSSVQGEGITLGERQIFIRFAGCNLNCAYCDTPESRNINGHAKLSVRNLLKEVKKINSATKHKTVAVTGGEPLLQAGFLMKFLPKIKKLGFRVMLETNGYFYSELKKVKRFCDIISMDLKLPSSSGKKCLDYHLKFLAEGGSKVYMKLVVCRNSPKNEIIGMMRRIVKNYACVPLVIQPATIKGCIQQIDTVILREAVKGFKWVRIIPQHQHLWALR